MNEIVHSIAFSSRVSQFPLIDWAIINGKKFQANIYIIIHVELLRIHSDVIL